MPAPSTQHVPHPGAEPVDASAVRRYRMERRDSRDGSVQVLARHVATLPLLTAVFDAFIHQDAHAGGGHYLACDPGSRLLIVPEHTPSRDQPATQTPQLDDLVLTTLTRVWTVKD